MKKKTKIIVAIVIGVLCILGVTIGILYANFKKSQVVEKPDENYDTIYEDKKDVTESIDDITEKGYHFSFTQLNNAKKLETTLKEVKTAKAEVTASSVTMKEMEQFANGSLEKYFKGYTQAFPKKHMINHTNTGYDFQLQKKSELGEEVYLLATDVNLYDRLPEAKETQVANVPIKIFYTHNQRTNIQEKDKPTTDQYLYEAVFVKNEVTYYYQMNFTGFDYGINMVKTTKEDTSKQMVQKLLQLILSDK